MCKVVSLPAISILVLLASKVDHKDCDSFGVAVLTHGDNSILYGVDNIIEVDKFLAPIKSCPTLAGKPKIFIFQVGMHSLLFNCVVC